MLEEIRNLPPHVVGIRATENITKEHYEQVFIPALKQIKDKKINLLLLLETDLADFSGGAYVKDILSEFEWNRIAIVTEQKWVDKATDMFSVIARGEYMGYEIAEIEIAKQWVEE